MITKEKIIDSMFGKPKAFELLKHGHSKTANILEKKICERCRYDVAEQSLADHIKNHKDADTIKSVDKNGNGVTGVFKNMIVIRGRFDDVIGWVKNWL